MTDTISANGASHSSQPNGPELRPHTAEQATEESNAQDVPLDALPTEFGNFFHTGAMVGTHGAVMALLEEVVARHRHGDWGDLDEGDKQQNLLAIAYGAYVMSSYLLPHTRVRIWVITEADRSLTTVLLPEEYENPRSWWTPEP